MEKLKQTKLILLLSYISLAAVAAAVISPALPAIKQSLKLSNGSLEWVISIFLISYAFGQLFYGPLANILGITQALKIGIIIYIIGIVICLFYSYQMDYQGILIGRFITGLGSASGLACTFILINETLPVKQAKMAFSYTLVSFTLGIGIAVAIGGVVTEQGHWRNCFFVLLIHASILLYLVKYLPQEKIKHKNQPIKKSILSLKHGCTNKRLILLSLTVGFSSMFTYGYNFAAPLYSQYSLGMSPSEFGYWNIMNTAGMLLSVLIGSRAIPRLGCYNTCKFGLIGMLICLTIFFLLLQHKKPPLSSFFLLSGSCNFFSGIFYASASYMATNAIADKGASASIMSFINMFCATLCVCILGSSSLTPMILFIAMMLLASIVLVSLIVIGQRHLDKECNHNLKPVAHK